MMKRVLRGALSGLAFSLLILLIGEAALGQAQALDRSLAAVSAPGSDHAQTPQTWRDAVPFTGTHSLYLPAIAGGVAPPALTVDIRNRANVLAVYAAYHETAPPVESGWTGNSAACDAGTTTPAYRKSLQDLVNFFRAMAGVPPQISFIDEYNAKAQQAALMMSVNGELSHEPPPTWQCYSAEGAEAAGRSNISICDRL